MKVGIYLPTYGPDAGWTTIRDVTLAAEAAGFDAVFACDHLLDGRLIESQHNAPPDIYECWTVLSALAAVTSRIRLGTSVLAVPYRAPGLVAKAAATLDCLSGGRLILGLGAGWNQEEFDKHGIPWEPVGRRIDRLVEAVDVLRGIWTEPGFNYRGRFSTIHDAACNPPPIQAGGPPIWIGGVGARARKLTARCCNGWLPVFILPEEFAALNADLTAAIVQEGRKPDSIERAYLTFASVAPTTAEAAERARPFLTDLARHQVDGHRTLDVEACCLVGSPEQVLERIVRYRNAGVTYLMLGFMPMEKRAYLDNIKLLGAQLLPVLNEWR